MSAITIYGRSLIIRTKDLNKYKSMTRNEERLLKEKHFATTRQTLLKEARGDGWSPMALLYFDRVLSELYRATIFYSEGNGEIFPVEEQEAFIWETKMREAPVIFNLINKLIKPKMGIEIVSSRSFIDIAWFEMGEWGEAK